MKYADWTDTRNTAEAATLVCQVRENDGKQTWNPSRDRVVARASFSRADAVALIRSGQDVEATLRADAR